MQTHNITHSTVTSYIVETYGHLVKETVYIMNLDEVKTIELYPSDHIFGDSDRIIVCGSSRTGKTYLVESLVKKYAHRF